MFFLVDESKALPFKLLHSLPWCQMGKKNLEVGKQTKKKKKLAT